MENNNHKDKKRLPISFAAIDPYVETNIVSPREKVLTGKNRVEWGDGNRYPDYLLELSKTTPSLRSIINGTVDFIAGDDITIASLPGTTYAPNVMNTKGDTVRDQVKDIARDYETYGGFALQIIRSMSGEIVEIYYIDMRYLRSNKENTVFYYCESWNKVGSHKVIEYPVFMNITPEHWSKLEEGERSRLLSSILYVKNERTQTYPSPVYCAAVKSCEIERCIDDYHLNAINNGFVSSAIINFNNGVPSEEMREEIENDFNEKFSGHQNAGRIVFSWNQNKDAATTIAETKVEDFGDRYEALAKHCRQQIFTAFRANPNLFGIPTDSLGFSQEEYESAFKLFNRTCVQPVQRLIVEAYDRIYGQASLLTIKPFTLDGAGEQNVQ